MHLGSFLIGLFATLLLFTVVPAPKSCGCDARKKKTLDLVGRFFLA